MGPDWSIVEEIPALVFDPLVRQAGWHFMWLQEACSLRGFGTAFLGRDILHEHRDNELVKLAATCTGDETNVPPLQFCPVQACGVSKARSIEDHTIEEFENLVATHVRGPFFLVKELLPFSHEGSSVVLIFSLVARYVPGNAEQHCAPSLLACAATKGAIDTLVKHWAAILNLRGIRVNAIASGVIDTDL